MKINNIIITICLLLFALIASCKKSTMTEIEIPSSSYLEEAIMIGETHNSLLDVLCEKVSTKEIILSYDEQNRLYFDSLIEAMKSLVPYFTDLGYSKTEVDSALEEVLDHLQNSPIVSDNGEALVIDLYSRDSIYSQYQFIKSLNYLNELEISILDPYMDMFVSGATDEDLENKFQEIKQVLKDYDPEQIYNLMKFIEVKDKSVILWSTKLPWPGTSEAVADAAGSIVGIFGGATHWTSSFSCV